MSEGRNFAHAADKPSPIDPPITSGPDVLPFHSLGEDHQGNLGAAP